MPMIDIGKAMLGITVAERFRRNRKITSTTSATARNSVNFTSPTDWRIDTERSYRICISHRRRNDRRGIAAEAV